MRWRGIAAVIVACGAGNAAAVVELAPDESLLPTAYAKYGLPDLNQPWDPGDHAQAAALIERVSREQPLRLPRLESPRSGPIFARLVSPANLAALNDPQASLMSRFELLRRFSESTRRVIDAYSAAEDTTDQVFFDEQLALQNYMLRTLLAADDMLTELIDTTPAGGLGDDTLETSRTKVRETLGRSVSSLMGVLRMSRYSFSDERLRAMRELQVILPLVYHRMPEEARTGLKSRLEEMREKEFDPMWRVCATTLEDLALVEDPALPMRPRVISSREADRNIIRRLP